MSEIFGNGVMGGGGLTNSKLALADAAPEDVRSGKKFYSGDKQIKSGTVAEVTQATPSISVSTAGVITATSTQTAGIVTAGTKKTTKSLTTQAAKTVTPSISSQTAVAASRYTTGAVTVAAVNGIIRAAYPAGDTCTCVNGSTKFTGKASDGVTVFIVPNTGTWTLSVTDGTQTATQSASISATSRSANVTLAYFSATISITYPASSTCTVTDSTGATVASDTNTGSSTKTWTATVNATGTYTITATNGDKTTSKSVSITTEGQLESVTLSFELVLFENGTLSTLAGSVEGNRVSVSSSAITTIFDYYSIGDWYFTKAISFADYKTLKITMNVTEISSGERTARFGVRNEASVPSGESDLQELDFLAYTNTDLTATGTYTFSVDVSKLGSTPGYVTFGLYGSTSTSKVWLE